MLLSTTTYAVPVVCRRVVDIDGHAGAITGTRYGPAFSALFSPARTMAALENTKLRALERKTSPFARENCPEVRLGDTWSI
jgi:hypothetical protein